MVKRLLLLSLAVAAATATAWPADGSAQPDRPQVPCPWVIPTGVRGPTPKWLGTIDIPRLGERAQFSRGTKALFHGLEDNAVNHGPALYPNTYGFGNLPGQDGTVGIIGHRTTHTHPFCRLDLLRPGYVIKVGYKGKVYVYRIVYIDPKGDPNSWEYFEYPWRYDETKPAKGVPVQYLVDAACAPPRDMTYRYVVIAKLVQIIKVKP